MDTTTRDYARLRAAVTACLNSHDLIGVLDLGAPPDEYDPEMEGFAQLLAAGGPITPEVVAGVWHKWFGDPSEQSGPPTAEMAPWPLTSRPCRPSLDARRRTAVAASYLWKSNKTEGTA